jgi:energy-coupling factor transporter ATP-binding protein EcfA2
MAASLRPSTGTYFNKFLEIEDVYVELEAAPKQAAKVSSDPLVKAPLATGRHDLWNFLGSAQDGFRNFAILGSPGSGKTTLLKHLAVVLAAHRGYHRGVRRTPVLLFLRDHAETIAANPDQSIIEIVNISENKMEIPAPDGWFRREFSKGHCLVMLDGLDEVADSNKRELVAKWVVRQMEAFDANNQFLVTSRPFGYRSNPLNRVTVLEVCPFTLEQTEQFIKQWYLADEAKRAQKKKKDEGVQIRAREGAKDLLKRLRATSTLAELAVNPLLLTMIANVHSYRSTLPGRRVELYAEIFEVFLGKRQQARGLDSDITPAQIKSVLQPLALAMMMAEKRELPHDTAVGIITRPLSLVSTGTTGEEFLAMVQNRSGLLVERESGTWGFSHLTFQEYLAASEIIEGRREEELVSKVSEPWWHETIRLYVAQADATRIVAACISGAKPTVAQLTLAVECLEEARLVLPHLREEIAALMEAGLEDADPEHARLAAETKLALRLKRLTRLSDDCYIDAELISCAEYQIFIDARRMAGDFRQPDHWMKTHFPPGSAREPLLGARPSDAEEFTSWLSERFGGEWAYQIPDGGWKADKIRAAGYWAKTADGIELCCEPDLLPRPTWESLQLRLTADREVYNGRPRSLATDFYHTLNRLDLARTLASSLVPVLDREEDRKLAVAATSILDRAIFTGLNLENAVDAILNRLDTRDRERTGDRGRSQEWVLHLALEKVLNCVCSRTSALNLDNATGRNRATDGVLDRVLGRAFAAAAKQERGLASATPAERQRERTVERERGSPNTIDLHSTIEVATEWSHDREIYTFLDRIRDRGVAASFSSKADRPKNSALDRARDLTNELCHAIDDARELSSVLDTNLRSTRKGISNGVLERALAHDLARELDRELDRVRALDLDSELDTLLDLVRDRNRSIDRSDTRILLLMRIADLALRIDQADPSHSPFKFLRASRSDLSTFNEFVDLYISLVLLEERIDGRLPAFEGILIMKVRKAVSEEATSTYTARA